MLLVSDQSRKMFERARQEGFAMVAHNSIGQFGFNVSLAAAKRKKAPIICQMSLGASKFASGTAVGNSLDGAIATALSLEWLAKKADVPVMFTTDHCQLKDRAFLDGILDFVENRKRQSKNPLFAGVMFDGAEEELELNVETSLELVKRCQDLGVMLEVELGKVGGEEDGAASGTNDELYTTPEQVEYAVDTLRDYMTWLTWALIFGNKHGAYKSDQVELRPEILDSCQAKAQEVLSSSEEKPLRLVFHGGSSTPAEIVTSTISSGVVKMNVDTETQWALGNSVAEYCAEYGEKMTDFYTGKKFFDARKWLAPAQAAAADTLDQKIDMLLSAGKA